MSSLIRPFLASRPSPLRLPSFRRLLVAAAPLALLSVSDAFIYLTFQRLSDLHVRYFPLLYLGTALIYLTLGHSPGASGRPGRALAGLPGGIRGTTRGVYHPAIVPIWERSHSWPRLVLLGTYYAATDGVLIAVASELVPPAQLTTGLALLTSVLLLSRLVASVLYGAFWSWQGPRLTLILFIIGLTTAMLCAAAVFSHQSSLEAG